MESVILEREEVQDTEQDIAVELMDGGRSVIVGRVVDLAGPREIVCARVGPGVH